MAVAAADPAPGQEKKEKAPPAGYDQWVTVEGKGKDGKAFKVEMVPGRRATTKAPAWRVKNDLLVAVAGRIPYSGVTLTDKDGKVWKIKETQSLDGPAYQLLIDEPAAPRPIKRGTGTAASGRAR